MATASYAAYILHIFFVVGVQAAFLPIAWPPGAKFAVVAVLGLLLSFGTGYLSRLVPGLRVLLGTSAPHGPAPEEPKPLPARREPGPRTL